MSALKSIAGALGRRVGTAFAGVLAAQGLPPETVDQAVLALGILGGVGFDLCSFYFYRASHTMKVA